jgi:hypothetical protein
VVWNGRQFVFSSLSCDSSVALSKTLLPMMLISRILVTLPSVTLTLMRTRFSPSSLTSVSTPTS